MRNRDWPFSSTRRSLLAIFGIASLAVSVAACTTVIEESQYEGISIGATKDEVLNHLDSQPAARAVQPALPRGEDARRLDGRSIDHDVIRLAAAPVGSGMLTDADRQYLQQYERWYFEEADGTRAVILVFGGDVLEEIHNRRAGTWFDSLF